MPSRANLSMLGVWLKSLLVSSLPLIISTEVSAQPRSSTYTKTKFGLLPIAVNEERTVKPIENDLIRRIKGQRERNKCFMVKDWKIIGLLLLNWERFNDPMHRPPQDPPEHIEVPADNARRFRGSNTRIHCGQRWRRILDLLQLSYTRKWDIRVPNRAGH